MEKSSTFTKILLLLCFLALLTNVIETYQTNKLLGGPKEETFIQRIIYNFPVEVKLAQKIINKNYLEFTVKDKNITEKIFAPVVKVSYDYWGKPYNAGQRYYTPEEEDNRLVYANINVKSLYKKKANLQDLVKAKVIYADKYEFDCFLIKPTKDKTDLTQHISLIPLQSEDVYFVAEMPKNFVNTKNSINLELFIDNTKYIVKLK